MSARPAAAAVLAVLLGVLGCGDDEGEGETGSEPETETEPGSESESESESGGHGGESPHAGAGDRPDERPLAEVARLTGEDGAGEGPAVEKGAALEAGAALETGDGRGIVVDFRQQGRIEVGPRTRASLGAESPMQVFLGEGRVRAQLPPAGNSPRPPLRVATPTVTVEIEGSGDAWVVALPDDSTWVTVLQGRVALSTGVTDEEGTPRTWLLKAGQALRVAPGEEPGEPEEGPDRIEGAAERTEMLREETDPLRAAKRSARIEEIVEEVDAARERLSAELERGEEIQKAHRKAVASKQKGAGALQRDLVEHSRNRYRLRQALLAAWERLAARAAARDEGEAAEAARARREPVLELLGRLEAG